MALGFVSPGNHLPEKSGFFDKNPPIPHRKCRRWVKAKTLITAEVNGRTAATLVKVIDKPEEKSSIPIEIDFVPEDFSRYRARWDEPKRPHRLLISAKHKSIERYLGSEDDNYPGQNSPWFRILLAEIVAESVSRKALLLEAKEHPWDFAWNRSKDPAHVIADDVISSLQSRLRQFVADAHAIMLSDNELKMAQDGSSKK